MRVTYLAGALLAALLLVGGCVQIRIPDPDVVYVAFGDSSTAGPSTRDYADQLRELLGEGPETFANEGHGGETSQEGLGRLRGLLADEIFPSATVLFYWESGNDITEFIGDNDRLLLFSSADLDYPFDTELTRQLDETQANIESAIVAGKNASLTVYVATYYFLMEDFQDCGALPFDVIFPGQAERANEYIARLNQRIRSAAAAGGAILVDVAARDDELRADEANYFNCNHLSARGNAIVAGLFFDAFTSDGE